jgi:hypothetical protein
MLFETGKSVVTSLKPATHSPLIFRDCNGAIADTGDLVADIDLNFLADSTLVDGDLVFKNLTGETFQRGPVVEGVIAGSNVAISSTRPQTLTGGAVLHQGRVTLDVQTNLAERELSPQIIRLGDAKERSYQNMPYIGFSANRPAAVQIYAPFNIPAIGLPPNPQVKLRLVIFGMTAGTLPITTLAYRRLPRPSGTTPVSTPTSDTTVACNTNLSIGAFQYLEVESALIPVTAGDTLLVTFTRNTSDGYAGEVGLLRIGAILVAG